MTAPVSQTRTRTIAKIEEVLAQAKDTPHIVDTILAAWRDDQLLEDKYYSAWAATKLAQVIADAHGKLPNYYSLDSRRHNAATLYDAADGWRQEWVLQAQVEEMLAGNSAYAEVARKILETWRDLGFISSTEITSTLLLRATTRVAVAISDLTEEPRASRVIYGLRDWYNNLTRPAAEIKNPLPLSVLTRRLKLRDTITNQAEDSPHDQLEMIRAIMATLTELGYQPTDGLQAAVAATCRAIPWGETDPWAGQMASKLAVAVEAAARLYVGQTPAKDRTVQTALEQELTDWWMRQARREVELTVPKAIEYGGAGRAVDLVDIGRDLLRAQGVADDEIDDDWATEVGIYFYLRGKISRWTAAVTRGDRVSEDTLFDIAVYTRMAQRVRECGGWPV